MKKQEADNKNPGRTPSGEVRKVFYIIACVIVGVASIGGLIAGWFVFEESFWIYLIWVLFIDLLFAALIYAKVFL